MALPRQAENPTFKPNEIGRELGVRWRALSDADKVPFAKLAKEDRERYERQIAVYVPPVQPAPPAQQAPSAQQLAMAQQSAQMMQMHPSMQASIPGMHAMPMHPFMWGPAGGGAPAGYAGHPMGMDMGMRASDPPAAHRSPCGSAAARESRGPHGPCPRRRDGGRHAGTGAADQAQDQGTLGRAARHLFKRARVHALRWALRARQVSTGGRPGADQRRLLV